MTSYTYPVTEKTEKQIILADEIKDLVGPPLDLKSQMYYGNTKYETTAISTVSQEIRDLVGISSGITAKFFLRPKGMIVLLEGNKDKILWAIPFHTMSIYSSREISIYSGKNCIKINRGESFEQQRFFRN